jgi:hypothetical protein
MGGEGIIAGTIWKMGGNCGRRAKPIRKNFFKTQPAGRLRL